MSNQSKILKVFILIILGSNSFLSINTDAKIHKRSSIISTDSNPFQVIYGDDNRFEVNSYPIDKFKKFSKSVAGRVNQRYLSLDPKTGDYTFFEKTLADVKINGKKFCSKTRFLNQTILPSCSGFLIKPDILVTAGHCIQNKFECQENYWVFDFLPNTKVISKENVYHCQKILKTIEVDTKYKFMDYAVIKLSKKVINRTPLKMRTRSHIKLKTPLVMIGHPYGLPMKITDGATNRFMSKDEWAHPIANWIKRLNYFTANLDAFGGNSGSPVFNQKTGLVEGILTDGDTDEVYNKKLDCFEVYKKSNKTKVSIEQVFRITRLKY